MLARASPVLARLPVDRALTFVEVGVNRGQLAEHLLRERPLLTWHGVDPWWHAPDHASRAYVGTCDGHALQPIEVSDRCYWETVRRVTPFGERATVIRMASPGAAAAFGEASMDAVFVDGDHSYDGVAADIAAWWPVVRPGGWLGGDDYRHTDDRFDFTGIDRAVEEFAARAGLPVVVEAEDAGGVPMGSVWFVRKP